MWSKANRASRSPIAKSNPQNDFHPHLLLCQPLTIAMTSEARSSSDLQADCCNAMTTTTARLKLQESQTWWMKLMIQSRYSLEKHSALDNATKRLVDVINDFTGLPSEHWARHVFQENAATISSTVLSLNGRSKYVPRLMRLPQACTDDFSLLDAACLLLTLGWCTCRCAHEWTTLDRSHSPDTEAAGHPDGERMAESF